MNILLCCAAGMSSSLIVTNGESSTGKGDRGKDLGSIGSEVRNHIDAADVLLLGPQVRYLLPKMKELCKEKGIPVDVIQSVHYGLCNGEAILQAALSMKP